MVFEGFSLKLELTRKKHKCTHLHFSNHQKLNEIGSQETIMIPLSYFSFYLCREVCLAEKKLTENLESTYQFSIT